jgi:hypothetical protein
MDSGLVRGSHPTGCVAPMADHVAGQPGDGATTSRLPAGWRRSHADNARRACAARPPAPVNPRSRSPRPASPGNPLADTGWAMGRTARAWVELMRRLGYQRYGVHGGDIGAGVSGTVAGLDGEHVIGVHVVTDPLTAANVATFLPGMADRLDPNDPVDTTILDG